MKRIFLKNALVLSVFMLILGLCNITVVSAQPSCSLSFTGPAGNTLTSYIYSYPNYPNSDASLNVLVEDANEPLPMGTYLAWCVDASIFIDVAQTLPGTLYIGTLFPTCDTNLNNELPPNHTPTFYVSPAVWQQVNYMLNHKNGAYFWDIQVAINDLVGGPAPGPSPPYPPFDPTVVQSLLTDASNNAAAWVPHCGNVIGAVYDMLDEGSSVLTNAVQLLMVEVPFCQVTFTNCPPDLSLGCNPAPTSIPDCQNPVDPTKVAATSCCGYPVTITCTKSESTAGCMSFRFLIYTASDGYGNTASCMQTISWTTDTNVPVILAAPTNSNLGCNPATLPTEASVKAQVVATDNCTLQSTNVSHVDSGSPCAMTRTFSISVTDGCGNTAARTVVYTWTVDTNAPVITSAPTSSNLGCNPAVLPTDASVKALVMATDNCTLQSTNVSHVDGGSPCAMTRTFNISVIDGCSNAAARTVVYTWTVDTNAPVITSAPTSSNLGCNPAVLPTDASVKALVVATDNCTLLSTNVSHLDTGSPCAMTRTFTITATDGCGNVSASRTVTYTWTVDTNAPVITSAPTNSNLGCNPANLPTDVSVKALVAATDNCTLQSTNVSHLDTTNGCVVTRTFTITAMDACGNVSTPKSVVYTWTADTNAPVVVCPPDITISNNLVPYCTFIPGDYGAVCNGTNAASILTNCFKKVYTNGFLQCGITNSTGYCLKFTTCTNIQKFVPCGGTPGCLKANYSNPTSCEAGVFAGQALCLKLNVDFGDAKSVTGFSAGCGDLVLNDPTCPLNGKSIRQILGICNTALGGGDISSYGCTITNLSIICSNLNQSFQNCTPSPWCNGHLVPPAITNVSPSVTGYATVVDKCSSTPTLTYTDVISAGTCNGNYIIARTWVAVDGCGNSNSCTQNIFVGGSQASVCGSVFMDCNGDGFLTPGFDSGIPNIPVTLKNGQNIAVATNLTDSQGSYCFYNLTPGTYTVSIAQPTGNVQTAGTHTNHWLNSSGQQCWNENDGYQHCKGANGVDCWTANDGYQHWKNSSGQDCWKDKYGNSHTQSCNYVSCDVPKGNAETFTLAPCQALTFVNFAYQGTVPKPVVCVTGPSSGICGQTITYTCCVTNTGTACFTACQVTACGKSFTCPALSPGQGCSFPINYQFQYGDFGWFNCQASASCYYPSSSSPCTAQATCNTYVFW